MQSRFRNVIAVCHALLFALSVCSCGKEPMRNTTYMQHACVHTCAGPECAVCVSECLCSDTHGCWTAPMKKTYTEHSTQWKERLKTNKNNVANIILWTTTLKRAEQWDMWCEKWFCCCCSYNLHDLRLIFTFATLGHWSPKFFICVKFLVSKIMFARFQLWFCSLVPSFVCLDSKKIFIFPSIWKMDSIRS